MKSQKINLIYIVFLFIAVLLSCFFHEFAHWITGELLGNKMSMSLNGASPISGKYINDWNANIITISAPIFTVLQAVIFYFIADKTKNINSYPFLFFPFVYRFFAGLANMFGPNDEGRFGLSFGLGLYTISILFSSFLLFLILRFSIRNKISLKFNLITFFLCSISLLLIVFMDQYFKIKIIG
ncbi:hypothetical protein [Aquimarina sp. 2201CG5-10]|uniref:hypothetical protein n=1 Tax=Aquimarina callyspongiae TaxID=3098150 RepID=UPI002AB5AF19|nr:hypothetical protein [Aquimarina sp. 2201CG5-10]MDY8137265.1 hypothetical protein [Aquimarina sp. 2201CG5-10]